MSKAKEKTIELMKKAGEYLPEGGYSQKELNLAFMFIKGYQQAEKDLELSWKDIEAIDQICTDVFKDGFNVISNNYYQEVLRRFKDLKHVK